MVRSRRRYFIRTAGEPKWVETDKATYVRHERNAGFHNTMGQPDEPATSGFSSSNYDMEGRLVYGDHDPNEQ
jgi:hypothetical protein